MDLLDLEYQNRNIKFFFFQIVICVEIYMFKGTNNVGKEHVEQLSR